MVSPLHIEYPGAHYHIINRVNAGETVFISNYDREKFLQYLEMGVGWLQSLNVRQVQKQILEI